VRNCRPRSVFLTEYYSGGQIKTDEMSRACDTYGLGEVWVHGFVGKLEGN
jgi:hypothetical protein